jgi:glycosyltransferase involved in cell wall biosynthesis
MTKGNPTTSVVMSVYNAVPTLREAVDSILGQTYTDFEFIIVDDGSEDKSGDLLDEYHDERIVRHRFEKNGGLTRAVNYGIEHARGKFIARMDADDISYPSRLEKEIGLIDSYEGLGLVSCWYRLIFDDQPAQVITPPLSDAELKQMLFYRDPFCHPAVVFRRELWEKLGGFVVDRYYPAEDWELWLRMAEISRLGMVPEVLLDYRVWPQSVSVYRRKHQLAGIRLLQDEAYRRNQKSKRVALTSKTLMRHHLLVGLLALIEGEDSVFHNQMEFALQDRNELQSDMTHIVNEVVFYALEAAKSQGGGKESELGFIQQFNGMLPEKDRNIGKAVLGEYHLTSAFRGYQKQDWTITLQEIWEGIKNRPSRLRDRGVISLLVQSALKSITKPFGKIQYDSIDHNE